MTTIYSGIPAAPGIGLGAVYVHLSDQPNLNLSICRSSLLDVRADADAGWQRFLAAQASVEAELEHLGQTLNSTAADLFSVHQVILHDKTLIASVREAILPSVINNAIWLPNMRSSTWPRFFAIWMMSILQAGPPILWTLAGDC